MTVQAINVAFGLPLGSSFIFSTLLHHHITDKPIWKHETSIPKKYSLTCTNLHRDQCNIFVRVGSKCEDASFFFLSPCYATKIYGVWTFSVFFFPPCGGFWSELGHIFVLLLRNNVRCESFFFSPKKRARHQNLSLFFVQKIFFFDFRTKISFWLGASLKTYGQNMKKSNCLFVCSGSRSQSPFVFEFLCFSHWWRSRLC